MFPIDNSEWQRWLGLPDWISPFFSSLVRGSYDTVFESPWPELSFGHKINWSGSSPQGNLWDRKSRNNHKNSSIDFFDGFGSSRALLNGWNRKLRLWALFWAHKILLPCCLAPSSGPRTWARLWFSSGIIQFWVLNSLIIFLKQLFTIIEA